VIVDGAFSCESACLYGSSRQHSGRSGLSCGADLQGCTTDASSFEGWGCETSSRSESTTCKTQQPLAKPVLVITLPM
jgi:hypothetical protein